MNIASRKSALFFCVIALVGGAILSPTIYWSGGFRPAEYWVTLRDQLGDLITDAELHVTGPKGDPADRYPILQYTAGNPVRSNDEGVFVIHQVRSGVQFGGKYMNLFGLIAIGKRAAPAFEIAFVRNGSPIGSVDFRSLDEGTDFSSAIRVRRTFTVDEIFGHRLREKLSEEELKQIAIDQEFPIVERAIIVKIEKLN